MRMNLSRLLPAIALMALAGCATYTSPFVHKSEAELDEMERQDEIASARFATGRYDEAEVIVTQLAEGPTVSTPLYELERVSILLMKGEHAKAHELMTKVRRDMDLVTDIEAEKEAASLWHGENKKVFKGDAHERATLYALLAMSYMERGELDDAERCVRNGILADSANTREAQYNSDYALLQYLGYVICKRRGNDEGAGEYMRELGSLLGENRELTKAYLEGMATPNAFLVVWAGKAPTYVRGGEYNEIRYAVPGYGSPFSFVSASCMGQEYLVQKGLADINFQATTRGGREMDAVLQDKASVKSGMEASGNILIVVGLGLVASANGGSEGDAIMMCIGGGCILVGGVFHVIGACINPDADIRYWKNLPGEFLIVPLVLPEGEHEITVNGYKLWDNVTKKSAKLEVGGEGVAVKHLSLMDCGRNPYNPVSAIYTESCAAADAADKPFSRDLPAEITPVEEPAEAEKGAAQ